MQSPSGYPQAYPQQQPPKKGMSTGCLVGIILAAVAVPLLLVFATLAVYGVRKYIANAKTAEAKNALGMIARDAVSTYEESGTTPATRHLCASASQSVPPSMASVRGMKYQSSGTEWTVDEKRGAGFACLGFSMPYPQYFRYSYTSTGTTFEAVAEGDLNGDGVPSRFSIRGVVQAGAVIVSPSILEESPDE